MNTFKCLKCGTLIEIDKALESQIESRILIETNERHQAALKKAETDAAGRAEAHMKERLSIELDKTKHSYELEREKLKSTFQLEAERNSQKQEMLMEQLRNNTSVLQDSNKELREEIKNLTKALLEEQKAKDNAELAARKKLSEEASRIREDARKEADESHRLKEQELQKQLQDTKKALDEARRKAEQGSEQLQGEVLELELETLLRNEFRFDTIEEVKKGQRGADILQYVKNQHFDDCGILLWEVKNAKWNKDWVTKMKEDIRRENATIGILVSRELPDMYGDMHSIENNVWVVKPKLAPALASALRSTLLQVHHASLGAENKDVKMEILYKFLTGVEFRNRIEAIIDNYNALLLEMEKERRAAEIRWGKQEKAIRAVISNTYGLYGDLQGITGSELSIPLLEVHDDEL